MKFRGTHLRTDAPGQQRQGPHVFPTDLLAQPQAPARGSFDGTNEGIRGTTNAYLLRKAWEMGS